MTPKLRRLHPLLQRAEERESAVARELAAKTRQLANHEQRLSELLTYADEYAVKPTGTTTNPALLANREQFRDKLAEAIGMQRRTVEQSRTSTEFERTRLMLAARDARVLEKLADNYRGQERRAQARIEQHTLDEHAARTFPQTREGETS